MEDRRIKHCITGTMIDLPPSPPTLKGQDYELDNSTDIDIEKKVENEDVRC